MFIARRLFVVPLANNDHGKTTMLRALVNQGQGSDLKSNQKSSRVLISPSGRSINAYVFGRSYQEKEKSPNGPYYGVEKALNGNDSNWRTRELIIMPSHVSGIASGNGNDLDDIDQMIGAAHGAGFDVICAAIVTKEIKSVQMQQSAIWQKSWDERWTIPNPKVPQNKVNGQLEAIGRDLWFWICRALAS